MLINNTKTKVIYKRTDFLIFILMCSIVIDVMGFGMIMPMMPKLFFSQDHVFSGYQIQVSYFLYGVSVSIWPLGNFLGSPCLGSFSDKYGRKNILVLCLLITGFSYFFTALSIIECSVVGFIIIRFITGFFGGAYDIAQASVADVSSIENKARNMGFISFAVSIGIILGPILSGFTTDSSIFSWFTITTPFWISAFLAIINGILIYIFFQETYLPLQKKKIIWLKLFCSFLFVFRDQRILLLGLAFTFFQLAWGMYIAAIPLILEKEFLLSVQGTGLFFTVLGAGIAFSVLIIQKFILKNLSLYNIGFLFLSLFSIITFFLLLFERNLFFEYIVVFICGACNLLVYTSFLAICSNIVSKDEQGKVMGSLGALASIAFFLSSLFAVFLSKFSLRLPITFVLITYLVSIFFLIKAYRKNFLHTN